MKLPLCANCGCDLTGPARSKREDSLMVMIDHVHEPHRPRYAWCGPCFHSDPWSPLTSSNLRPAEVIATIEARGPGRVIRRVRR